MKGDVGRAAVYEAEAAAFGGTTLEDIRPLAELITAAAALTAGEWWRGSGGPAVVVTATRPCAVSSSARQSASAAGRPVEIRLAPGQATTATLAHELAHALAGVANGHDARFRRANVDVCALLGGHEAAHALGAAYAAFGVAPARRRWSPPEWAMGHGFAVVR